MKNSALGLLSAGALAIAATMAPMLVHAQSVNFEPAVIPLGPSFAYVPAYYFYVPAHRPVYRVGYGFARPRPHFVWCGDVYPPDIYGPHLCAAFPRP